jgi:hypothetical protein
VHRVATLGLRTGDKCGDSSVRALDMARVQRDLAGQPGPLKFFSVTRRRGPAVLRPACQVGARSDAETR